MPYKVKEIFLSLQGEGAQTGRVAVFCRFSGCNLWNGKPEDRAKSPCSFCDTDFLGETGEHGGTYQTPESLANAVKNLWPAASPGKSHPEVICTGGEPLLQLDPPLISALHQAGFDIAIETNGTLLVPAGVDWVCVSPKAGISLTAKSGNELKLVFPQAGASPEAFADLEFDYFFLQPMAGPEQDGNTRRAIRYCLDHPQWRLSLQTHKFLGIP